jgi:hypothetical protein
MKLLKVISNHTYYCCAFQAAVQQLNTPILSRLLSFLTPGVRFQAAFQERKADKTPGTGSDT